MTAQASPITALRISLASPEMIRSWSGGAVTEAATINYLSGKPEPGGLFCERIFGPTRDFTCWCGKYKRARRPGFVCEICGVELARSAVRRERMGHIELATPIVHPWFVDTIALLLDLSTGTLRALLSHTNYLVTALDEQQRQLALASLKQCEREERQLARTLERLTVGEVLEGACYHALLASFGQVVQAGTGGDVLREQLERLDLDTLAGELRQQMRAGGKDARRALRRLEGVEALRASTLNPAWMILTMLPVLPPELRPLVRLDNGHVASSDLNVLYERVIHRNNRIKHFQELGAPTIILNHEKRLLQQACEALLDNKHKRVPATGSHGPLQSLTDGLEGKEGRLRRNLLGKRVDYSGRSVIVGDPSLLLHQCGLPTAICLELFKPFMIHRLLERNLVGTVKAAKRMVERKKIDPLLWDLLEEVMDEKVVLLNRAPTLHRLSIQAFEAIRVEGSAIRLHPLVCSAFNADFDGDQMAVHLPLSDAAQAEARMLLLSTATLRSPATGEPSITLSQEIVLGLFYLTQARPSAKQAGRIFADADDALLALEHGIIDLHTPLVVRISDPLVCETPSPDVGLPPPTHRRVSTTAGRLLFNQALPEPLRFKNYEMTKERLKLLVAECLQVCGTQETAQLADRLKTLGYRYATRSGISFATSDIGVPPQKQTLVAQAEVAAHAIDEQMRQGIMTDEERHRQLIALWTQTTEEISHLLPAQLDPWGSLATIIHSGATKAKFQQIRQLCGIRGLMANPSGQIIPLPVTGNYLEGLAVWMIFIAASGARKGFMDRSLNTARSGYLTRKLVEAGMEVWIAEEDCGTADGLLITEKESVALGLPDMRSRLVGRVLATSLPVVGLPAGTLLTEALVTHLLAAGITAVPVRSPLTCQSSIGICRRCYGTDLATGQLVRLGTAVGVIAGQSIGEPGTQLTMRTFHSGGIANAQGDITAGLPRVEELFEAREPAHAAILSEIEGVIQIQAGTGQNGDLVRVIGEEGQEQLYEVPTGRELLVQPSQRVEIGTALCTGPLSPRHLLRLVGREAAGHYLVNEVQRVYRNAGVYINDKHVEIIVRQMLRYVTVDDSGDSQLLPGQVVDRFAMQSANAALLAQGGCPAVGHPLLLGLTQAVFQTGSWVAAASFQQTSRVLARAAIGGQCDPLIGFKEQLVIGGHIRAPLNAPAQQEEAFLSPPVRGVIPVFRPEDHRRSTHY